jgi:hypothetical protein
MERRVTVLWDVISRGWQDIYNLQIKTKVSKVQRGLSTERQISLNGTKDQIQFLNKNSSLAIRSS